MIKHTAGEWIAAGNGVHVKTRCVATTHIEPREQRHADARLIAAAPDLLEFAQEWISKQGSDENYMTQKARAAIAKATGEQP